jgi:acetyltransferase-like isoleucine patch superfamily enzyme
MKRIVRRTKAILLEFENMLLIWAGHVPSHVFRKFCYRLAGMKIGKGSTVHTNARFYDVRNIKIGKDSIIGECAVLDGRDKLIIGDHVDLASEVMIYNSHHDVEDPEFKAISSPVEIEDYVFVGPRSTILPGVKVKRGAIIAAGSVVTKDVDEYVLVGGIPAKPIRERNLKELNYKLGRAAWFR